MIMTRDLSYLQVEVAKFSIISRQSSGSPKKEAAEFLMAALSENRQTVQLWAITFHVSGRRREMYIDHARPCVCLSVPRCIPTLLYGPGCNLREWQGLPTSCALNDFAIGFVATTT